MRCPIDGVADITTVSVDYVGVRSYTDLTANDYDPTPLNAALNGIPYTALAINAVTFSGAYFPEFQKGVRVIGKFGYPTVPADIKEATLSLSQSLNDARSGQTSAGKMTVTAAGIVIRPEDVPAFVQKVIQHYRNLT